jgi:O-antigen ligase
MPLAALMLLTLLLPFEPMAPLARVLGLQVSYLEAFAFVLLGAAAAGVVARRPSLPIPLAAPLFLFLAAFLVSASFAEGPSLLPLKFTARMAAAVGAFLVASCALSLAPRFSLLFSCLSLAGALTAAIAVLEAGPWSFDETLLAPFREHAFEVGGRTRAAATFAYPNIAGGFLVLALAPTLYFTLRGGKGALASIAACGIVAAILLTYSRGALLGAAASGGTLWWLVRSRPLLRLEAGLLLVAAAFFAAEPSFRWRASSEGDRSWYEANIEPRATSLELEPRELVRTGVSVTNVGKLTWGSKGKKPFHLSYRWFQLGRNSEVKPLTLEGERTRLDDPLRPGQTLDVVATVRAPEEPGSYVLIWDMVHEHTTWFSDKVGLGAPVNVVVGGGTAAVDAAARDIRSVIAERSWRPGRAELWAIALSLFRSHPLLGVGPDNFRWLYGPRSGHAVWDTRIFSNSLYLELLSTVGLAGFSAFVFLLAKALSGLWRRAISGPWYLEAATLVASLVGFLTHGVFDYLLAFTPIYLAFFLLLGASSAVIRGVIRGEAAA